MVDDNGFLAPTPEDVEDIDRWDTEDPSSAPSTCTTSSTISARKRYPFPGFLFFFVGWFRL